MPKGNVYLIHFERPLHHARHYVGYAKNIEERMDRHRAGLGSRLMAAVTLAGIEFDVVKVWKRRDRNFERSIKKQKNTPRMCPACKLLKKQHSPSPLKLFS